MRLLFFICLSLFNGAEAQITVAVNRIEQKGIVVKIIDVYPDFLSYNTVDIYAESDAAKDYPMGGYQMLVRAEIFRGRYRNSYENPSAFTPGKVEEVKFELPSIAHTFKKGHRLMIQVQSSWFPLVDRNPQQFIDIYHCSEKDFIKSDI